MDEKALQQKLTELFSSLQGKSADYLKGFSAAAQSLFNVEEDDSTGLGSAQQLNSQDPQNPPTHRKKSKSGPGSGSSQLYDQFNEDSTDEEKDHGSDGKSGSQSNDNSGDNQKSNDGKNSKSGQGKSSEKRDLKIGDKGDKAIQDAEDIERKANAVFDDAGELIDRSKEQNSEGEGSPDAEQAAKDARDKAAQAGDQAKDLADELKDSRDKSSKSSSNKTKTSDLLGDPEKIKARLEDLKKLLSNAGELLNKAMSETRSAKYREKKDVGDLAAQKYKDSPLTRFRESLNGFLRRETDYGRDKTWKRFSKNYSDSEIIRKGTARNVAGHIPIINVYFDQSSSWDADKIKVGEQAIATLNKYVQRNEVKIKVFYFSDEIFTDLSSGLAQQATSAGPDIVEHIRDTHADNVIIMTDSDTNSQGKWYNVSPVTVPGAVWFLFKDGVSERLQQYIHGRKLTKSFKI